MTTYAIILASGKGTRFGADIPKQFLKIGNKTILQRSIEVFENNDNIDSIIIVITPEYLSKAKEIIKDAKYRKIKSILAGGETRKQSSNIGINAIKDNEADIIIHDCARPFLSQDLLNKCINALKNNDAVVSAIPSTDTIIQVQNNIVKDIPQRNTLMRVQTPQCFKLTIIKKAHELSKDETNFTDDCGLIIKHNLAKVFVVNGDIDNIKITYPNDIIIAERILNRISK